MRHHSGDGIFDDNETLQPQVLDGLKKMRELTAGYFTRSPHATRLVLFWAHK